VAQAAVVEVLGIMLPTLMVLEEEVAELLAFHSE
jgi:hypothetical protein